MSAQATQDLSAAVNILREKAETNKTEREQLVQSIRQIQGEIEKLLSDLGAAGPAPVRRRGSPAGSAKRRPGRPRKTGKPGRPKGSGMSAEGRARISAAQKKRWAALKTGEKKK